MKIIYLNGNPIKYDTIAAIGFFDGVHLAHKELINKTIKIGKEKNLSTAIITFDIHPKSILFDLDYFYLTPIERKIKLFKQFDIDFLYVIEFSKEKASLTPKQFINRYLKNINTIVCGFDFKFGVRGSGNINTLLQDNSFKTIIVNEVTYEGYKVGSTHIRDLIRSGQVNNVKEVLGDYYSISGEVIHGSDKGHMLGFPTANINTSKYFIPKRGVYVSLTKVADKWYKSMTSIGHNPTLNCRVDLSVESNIFDFNKKIYGEIIEIKFIKRLRDEIKFTSVEALIAEIKKDKIKTLKIFKDLKK